MTVECPECGLPDLHDGAGDGIGSCGCPRCEYCGNADPAGWCQCVAARSESAMYSYSDDWTGVAG